MILRASRFALRASLLCGFLLGVNAVPSVNVALRTSFAAPPFLLELLETAAEENATSYFPLLDRIVEGYFDSASTDQELYTSFRAVIERDGHLSKAEDLSSFDFALSIHSVAPRIEAHYQYYQTAVQPWIGQGEEDQDGCESWVYTPFTGQRHCSPEFDASTSLGSPGAAVQSLPFDRVLGDAGSEQPSILYGDLMSDSFRRFHKTISKTAKEGKTSYRVRYKPSSSATFKPLTVSGYGVELALKRTDYIVIDDRQSEDASDDSKATQPVEATLIEEEVSDLRPLSASELLRLDMKAASFVMASDSPFDTLERLSQDFPRYSSTIAGVNVSDDFKNEHYNNRQILLPSGFNALWINGVQIMARDIDAFSLLEHLRNERKMINSVREIGLTGPHAIDLLAHEAITTASTEQDAPRYDWRDDIEGGNVIVWLNDLEKDKRYADFPDDLTALLGRTYPGQLAPIRKNVHNVIIPLDLSLYSDAVMLVESLQNFVKRKLPIRFGIVPRLTSPAATQQAKVIYHLLDTYGLSTTLRYLEKSLVGLRRKYGPPSEEYVVKATEKSTVRTGRVPLSFRDILSNEALEAQVGATAAYLARFGTTKGAAPVLANGVPIPRNEDWLQAMSEQLQNDLMLVQKAIFEGEVNDESYVPDVFLYEASVRRLPLVVPENDKDLRHLNLGDIPEIMDLPSVSIKANNIERELVHIVVVADIGTQVGFDQLLEALLFQRQHDNVELAFLQTSANPDSLPAFGAIYDKQAGKALLGKILEHYDAESSKDTSDDNNGDSSTDRRRTLYARIFEIVVAKIIAAGKEQPPVSSNPFKHVVDAIGLQPGQKAIVLNGRIVGPIPRGGILQIDDLEVLFNYERKKRLLPASLAVTDLKLDDKATTPFAFAKISNLIALSQISDVPEGIFEASPNIRMDLFKGWDAKHTAITSGDLETATIQMYASIDPASEIAQRWIPIVKALSQLSGVYTSVFLNPKDQLQELPIKRFYRYLIEPAPTFNADGSLRELGAHFANLPAEALLNTGMDLPASWLVAPKESVHDPDNIKLSAIKAGSDIETIYELEHILIEGHSRDVTLGPPPRGAQLVLGTELDPHFADTIIMANLGYFQFKANPGIYNLAMQQGRSEEIFHINSAGTKGYNVQPGDNGTELALMSFRGATVFPRLSRKSGMDEEDVLEASKSPLESLSGKLLSQNKYLSKAAKIGSSWFGGKTTTTEIVKPVQADINIFSVASGHLYERMLNIMMLSVMKHTQHTVKFWFIEQFLSPSFKDFLPVLAEEYGFQYEMVTYKWPHWLRGQKEKQREIWGYKILFLDVLFPLDLDKVIFVDADQIVRTDMYELVQHDLHGAPYGFTPMCDSRTEMEGFRFWKQGYWANYLKGRPYHISALYVVDLKRFRQIAAGDRLRQQYQMLSADPGSLSNLDQDLPNHMQMVIPIHSLPQDWLWCETWCSDEALTTAKTIDLCNNPQTKEPKLDRARRQVPEWTVYDDEIAAVARRRKEDSRLAQGRPIAGDSSDAGPQAEADAAEQELEEESIQERLQREDAERERKKHVIDEL